ncbi:hypothetical protein ABIB35_003348 [Arthrobacter sp. UYP6]
MVELHFQGVRLCWVKRSGGHAGRPSLPFFQVCRSSRSRGGRSGLEALVLRGLQCPLSLDVMRAEMASPTPTGPSRSAAIEVYPSKRDSRARLPADNAEMASRLPVLARRNDPGSSEGCGYLGGPANPGGPGYRGSGGWPGCGCSWPCEDGESGQLSMLPPMSVGFRGCLLRFVKIPPLTAPFPHCHRQLVTSGGQFNSWG